MKKWKRHIAVSVIGIFLYPMLYQPLHVIHHHGHESQVHVCSLDNCHTEKGQEAGTECIEPARKHCHICDFKFSVNDLPVIHEPFVIYHRYNEIKSEISHSHYCKVDLSLVNPRAPPLS
jgi:hypothetical protein